MKATIFTIVTTALLIPSLLFAQQPKNPRAEQIGILDLDGDAENFGEDVKNTTQQGIIALEQDEVKQNPYQKTQDDAIKYMTTLQQALPKLMASNSVTIPTIAPDVAQYIGACYLLCSIKKGICPQFLEALREADTINAITGQNQENAVCNTMNEFWSGWLALDMQKKLDHQVKLNQISQRNKFNRDILPPFLPKKCDLEIRSIAKKAAADKKGWFIKRYSDGSQISTSIKYVTDMVKYFRAKNVDVFASTMPQ